MQLVIDGLLTHYETVGQKENPVLLILHGWKRSFAEWLPTAKILSQKYFVVLLDLPGFGQTALPKTDFSIYDYADFTEKFLQKMEIKKVNLLGHSFGGRIGILLGAKTHLIDKLILVDAAGVEKRSIAAKIKTKLFVFLKVFLPNSFVEKLRDRFGSVDYKTAGNLRTIFVKVINADLTYLLPKIAAPTLIIWGNKDTEILKWKIKLMQQKIPQNKVRVVWGAGHDPHLEKPKDFLAVLEEELV